VEKSYGKNITIHTRNTKQNNHKKKTSITQAKKNMLACNWLLPFSLTIGISICRHGKRENLICNSDFLIKRRVLQIFSSLLSFFSIVSAFCLFSRRRKKENGNFVKRKKFTQQH
jgi:hypothetical protein